MTTSDSPDATPTATDVLTAIARHPGAESASSAPDPAEALVDDEDLAGEDTQTIRAKWTMDGAATLSQAAQKLREQADNLEQLERDGWQLTGPVDDDYGFITQAGTTAT